MILHTKDLKRYITCPMMYKFQDPIVEDSFFSAVKQTLIHLYIYEMINKKKIGAQSVLAKWDKTWGKKDRSVEGWLIIQKYIKEVYSISDETVHLVDMDYQTQWGEDFLNTHFDIVLSDERGKLTFIEFGRVPPIHSLASELESDIEAKAKLLILQKDLNHNNIELIKYSLNKRLNRAKIVVNNNFVQTNTKLINDIISNIKQGIFHPSPSCDCKHPRKCKNS